MGGGVSAGRRYGLKTSAPAIAGMRESSGANRAESVAGIAVIAQA